MGESSAGCLIVFLCCLFVYHVSGGNHQFLRGQCYAYCLTRYTVTEKNPIIKHQSASGESNSIKNCKKDTDCKWCLYVCDRHDVKYYANLEHCRYSCQHCFEGWCQGGKDGIITDSCNKTCGFVNRAATMKAGLCRDPTTLKGFQAACVLECRKDDDCSQNNKCCQHDCGSSCQKPMPDEKLPPKPLNIELETKKDGSVLVKWMKGRSDERRERIKPELYLIQYWPQSSSSRRHRITTRRVYKVLKHDDISPGSRYKFRIAAINIHGSNGYTNVKLYTKPIRKPAKPVNLHIINERTRSTNNSVDLTISWQPPRSTYGLKIVKYLIYWVHLPATSTSYLRQGFTKKSVTASRNRFMLPHLIAGRKYLIQVRALARFNGNQIKGRPASLHIETYSPPATADDNGDWRYEHNNNNICNITVLDSYYHQGNLKAVVTWQSDVSYDKYMIFWKAENCKQSSESSHFQEKSATSHRMEFEFYNLQFACNYVVRIHPVDVKGDMKLPGVTSFKTPYCTKVRVKGRELPECPVGEFEPGQPQGVEVNFISDLCFRLDVVVTWEVEPWREGRQYIVLWGASTQSTISQVIYTSQPHQLISSGNVNKVILSKVEYSTHYSVQLSIKTLFGVGLPVIRHFTTPTQRCTQYSTSPANYAISTRVNRLTSDTIINTATGLISVGNSAANSGIIYSLITILILLYTLIRWC